MYDHCSVNWRALFSRWSILVSSLLAGIVIAGVLFVLASPLWQASALFQIGQVGKARDVVGDNLIDLPESIALQMVRPAFIEAAAKRAGHPETVSSLLPEKYSGKGWLNIRIMNTGGLMEITVKAPAAELAKELADGVAKEALDEQNRLIEPRLRYAKEVFAKAQVGEGKPQQFDGACFDENIRETHMIGDVEVINQPIAPKLSQFVAMGVLLGAVFSGAWLWMTRKLK